VQNADVVLRNAVLRVEAIASCVAYSTARP
jgi:hypothetical protein